MKNANTNDVRNIYEKIRSGAAPDNDSSLDEALVEEMETLPANADSMGKPILIKKVMMFTKLPKEFLRKMDEENLKAIYTAVMSLGKSKLIKALKNESIED